MTVPFSWSATKKVTAPPEPVSVKTESVSIRPKDPVSATPSGITICVSPEMNETGAKLVVSMKPVSLAGELERARSRTRTALFPAKALISALSALCPPSIAV